MRIRWYGQAAYLLTSDKGPRVVCDPYMPEDRPLRDPGANAMDRFKLDGIQADHKGDIGCEAEVTKYTLPGRAPVLVMY